MTIETHDDVEGLKRIGRIVSIIFVTRSVAVISPGSSLDTCSTMTAEISCIRSIKLACLG